RAISMSSLAEPATMGRLPRVGTMWVLVLFLLMASVLAVTRGSALASVPAPPTAALPCRDGGDHCIGIGFTDAWFNGRTVQLGYSHRFFCAQPPTSEAASECEAGEAAAIQPPSGPVVSEVYLLIPNGFSPPA